MGGGFSAEYFLRHFDNFNSFIIYPWKAYPLVGTSDADPYSCARTIQNGTLALGRAEGLVFEADTDSQGQPLMSSCSYKLYGTVPEARFFTLYAADSQTNVPLSSNRQLPDALKSFDLLYDDPNNSFTILVSPYAQPGNWLSISQKAKKIKLILSLYNTSIVTSAALQKYKMPRIERLPKQRGYCE